MICINCRKKDHDVCIEASADKVPSPCDCRHRTGQKYVVLPASQHKEEAADGTEE